jgi:hypothetical protein
VGARDGKRQRRCNRPGVAEASSAMKRPALTTGPRAPQVPCAHRRHWLLGTRRTDRSMRKPGCNWSLLAMPGGRRATPAPFQQQDPLLLLDRMQRGVTSDKRCGAPCGERLPITERCRRIYASVGRLS